ncbi:MAG TPA: hypothetical protein VIW29_08415, partial [Polyangiaceae bacterium]
ASAAPPAGTVSGALAAPKPDTAPARSTAGGAPRGGSTAPSASSVAPLEAVSAGALLKLTADVPATVTVVGPKVSETLDTPVRQLKLPAGIYRVTFRSPTFGEPVAAPVELGPGDSRSVHADFRAALPTVSVR